jgi:hypothetical protein
MSRNDQKRSSENQKPSGEGRWVTKEELEEMVNKRIASIAQRCANRARGEGREELAQLWDFFVVSAIARIPEPEAG